MSQSDIDKNIKCGLDGITPLILAVQQGSLEMVKLLLELGASVDEKSDKTAQTPLGFAAELANTEV